MEKRTKFQSRASPSIFVAYSILTKQYFVYNPLAKILHRSGDVEFGEAQWYTGPNAADEAILNEHFYRHSIEEPTEKQPFQCQTEQPLDYNPPPDPPKPTAKMSRELAGLATSVAAASMAPEQRWQVGRVCTIGSQR
jgi:hypothetical protein